MSSTERGTFQRCFKAKHDRADLGVPCSIHFFTKTDSTNDRHLSIDFGQTWTPAKLARARNRYGPRRFATAVSFPKKGYYEIWARATDDKGRAQPMVVPGWNAGGYGSNACREGWIDSIRWMQRNQELGALGSTEEPIVSYLAKHYPVPKTAPWRRPPLPAHLMPK